MKLQETQELSVSGVAVLGNTAMQDIIWPKDSSKPFAWIKDGYIEMNQTQADRWKNMDQWYPVHPKRTEIG